MTIIIGAADPFAVGDTEAICPLCGRAYDAERWGKFACELHERCQRCESNLAMPDEPLCKECHREEADPAERAAAAYAGGDGDE